MDLLVASGGSPHSRMAVDYAARAALALGPTKARLHVVCVSVWHGEDCDQSLAALSDLLEGVPGERIVRQGSASREILNVAQETDADVIVVGERGHHSLAKRMVLGATANKVARGADRPVLVVKGNPEDPPPLPRRILVAVALHDSARAHRLLRVVALMAKARSAEVTVLHVMSQLPGGPVSDPRDWQASSHQLIDADTTEGRALQRDLEVLTRYGIESRAIVRHGLVVDEVRAEIESGGHDLLCIGAHEQAAGWMGAVLVEDVAARLLASAPCPVLVVRRPGEPESPGPTSAADPGEA